VSSRASRAALFGVCRAERRKLLAQLSTRALVLVCALGPIAFGVILKLQSGVPGDTLFGVWVHSSGYAASLVVLGFGGFWGFPLLAGVLAGDIFSSEDRHETWKTILTRSASRRDVFAGKVLTALALTAALIALAAVSSLVSGVLLAGGHPLVGLSGTVVPSLQALLLVLASWALAIPAALAFTSLALLLSLATRNGVAGVLGPVVAGLAMQLLNLIGKGTIVHMILPASAFDGWHGLFTIPRFYAPMLIGVCVCLAWVAVCLRAAWSILCARDVAGAPVSRRPGWILPARVVVGATVLVVLLGVAAGWGPAAVTRARLEASLAPAFSNLTVLQQRELGRRIPGSAELQTRTGCSRRSGTSEGPGDDWSCTVTVFTAQPGVEPYQLTPVTYDVSVESDGCFKAQAPPSFVGQQTMTDSHGRQVVNPLFTIYGCFDTVAAPAGCPATGQCAAVGSHVGVAPSRRSPTSRSDRGRTKDEVAALRRAERAAGPRVMREIDEAERRQAQGSGESPLERSPTR
jgi:ABC-2 type transport system permease protein